MLSFWKYLLFVGTSVAAYFEPINGLLILVATLFIIDFITGVLKSVKLTGKLCLKSKKLRWSFVKMLVYMAVMAVTFYVCEAMNLSSETSISVVKVEVWMVVYIEGLSIVENLKAIFTNDKFLKFLHYMLSVEFLKYVPFVSKFLKEDDEIDD
ncbi:MAG: phage holin family protein [Prevotellaceae bacterium]|jgi:phage-related holin|nr:phage holin family protein [Prevotellaceae bacterium]